MSFLPALPLSGYGGWAYLKRTAARQIETLAASPQISRDTDYFRNTIGKITSASDLVADKRLLRVALTAAGLEDDIGNTAFIRKVLQDGTLNDGALANRLADTRYRQLAETYGFGDFSVPNTQLSDFADRIVSAYHTRTFETAVGTYDNDLRLALNAGHELAEVASGGLSADAAWLTVLGSPPLRSVFQTAFGLPSAFAGIDLDQQVETLRTKAADALGDGEVAQFEDPVQVEKLVKRFLLLGQMAELQSASTSGSVALQLLAAAGASA